MKTQPAQWAGKFAAVTLLWITLHPLVAETITWTINITPPGSCKIQWQTTSPVQNGTLSKSGKITFNKNANENFKFFPQPGFKLIHVYKNLEDQIGWIASNGYQDSYGQFKRITSSWLSRSCSAPPAPSREIMPMAWGSRPLLT